MAPAYLLDTNIVSYLLREAPKPLVDRIAATRADDIAISIVTAMELLFGTAKQLGATLVTNSTKEFRRVPELRCEDWTKHAPRGRR